MSHTLYWTTLKTTRRRRKHQNHDVGRSFTFACASLTSERHVTAIKVVNSRVSHDDEKRTVKKPLSLHHEELFRPLSPKETKKDKTKKNKIERSQCTSASITMERRNQQILPLEVSKKKTKNLTKQEDTLWNTPLGDDSECLHTQGPPNARLSAGNITEIHDFGESQTGGKGDTLTPPLGWSRLALTSHTPLTRPSLSSPALKPTRGTTYESSSDSGDTSDEAPSIGKDKAPNIRRSSCCLLLLLAPH